MTNVPSDVPRSFWRKLMRSFIEVDTARDAAGAVLGLGGKEQGFELPGQLFKQLPFAVYVCDRDGLVLRYNRRAAELWGRSPKLGDPDERFCGSYRCSAPTAVFSRTINVPWPMCCALVFLCANRKSTLSDLTARAASHSLTSSQSRIAKDSCGNIVGAVNCFQDITERKRSEEAALRLAAIVESSDDAIVSKDLDGIITSWNGGAERIFGYLAEEIIGKPITPLIPPDRQKEEEAIIDRIRRGQRVEHYETFGSASMAVWLTFR